jgi:hypothetical protein
MRSLKYASPRSYLLGALLFANLVLASLYLLRAESGATFRSALSDLWLYELLIALVWIGIFVSLGIVAQITHSRSWRRLRNDKNRAGATLLLFVVVMGYLLIAWLMGFTQARIMNRVFDRSSVTRVDGKILTQNSAWDIETHPTANLEFC